MSELSIFARFETKFLISYEQRKMMEWAMRDRMTPDPHGQSTICNIYYDTPDFRLIRHSLEKPVYKEKLRLRSYGRVDEGQDVFLELKKKYKGVVYKRRIELPENVAMACMTGEVPLKNNLWLTETQDLQIAREIDYFRNFYPGLAPRVHLSYDRCAYFSKDDPNLRVTFDRHIRWRDEDLSLTSEPGGFDLLERGYSLMEIKSSQGMPKWMVEVINRCGMKKASFSKYGKAFETIMQLNENLFSYKDLILAGKPAEADTEKAKQAAAAAIETNDNRKDVYNGNFISKHNDRNTNNPKLYDKLSGSIDTGRAYGRRAVI